MLDYSIAEPSRRCALRRDNSIVTIPGIRRCYPFTDSIIKMIENRKEEFRKGTLSTYKLVLLYFSNEMSF